MKKRHRSGDGASVVARECEAFLTGTLAEYWEERGTVVPVWAWTNLLAHGSEELIGESATHSLRPRRAGRSWHIARSFLAHQVLDAVESGVTLEDLQSQVLIHLELEMALHPEVSQWGPQKWGDTVDHAIRTQHATLDL
jgi:hypothetical protein